ncbi:MAG: glycosyltransferase family 2 protein [Patescibacteria group bacterium]|jgi:glycosyltransferase involved in cell wall biosynthesis
MNTFPALSIIIPNFNDGEALPKVIDSLVKELTENQITHEIIIVNDGSTDQSGELLRSDNRVRLLNHPYNKGYGASLKTGAKNARHEWLAFFDADGQHQAEDIKKMLAYTENFDLISGERTGYQGPWIRQPGKKLIHLLAIYLLDKKITDFNCGLRIIKKKDFLRFVHILPNGFSCSTTTLFAFLREGLNVKFVPIQINKRESGQSMVKPKEFITYLFLILRLIMLFSPLRIFLPIGLLLFLLGGSLLAFDVINQGRISASTVLVSLSSILIFFFGLIADQISALRREINNRQ